MAIPQGTTSAAKPKRHGRRETPARSGRTSTSAGCPTVKAAGGSRATSSSHRHKPRRNHFRGPGKSPPRRPAAAAAAGSAPAGGDSRPAGAYQGPFGAEQALRLVNRAGFGPVPGQVERLVSLGLVGAVQSLTRPSGAASLSGPAPVDDDGNPIAPADAWGHDHLWWLDRMVRSDQPLVERMALVFHDWFATSLDGVSKQQQMIDQSNLFRSACFGSFLDLFKAVTVDPAMLQWLNGNENRKGAPNENYAREMMELFSLGADRGAYSEDDIREAARALTGWRNDWSERARRPQLPLRPQTLRRQHRRRSSARPATGAGKTPAGSASSTRCTPPSSSRSCGATSSRSRRRPATRDAWSRPTAARLADPAGAGGDPDQPRALRGAADGEAAGRAAGGDAARAGPADRHRGLDLALRTGRAGALPPAQRLRLGRRPLARHLAHAGALEPRLLRPRRGLLDAWDGPYSTTETRRGSAGPRRSPPGATRPCGPSTGRSCSSSPSARRT